MSAKGGLMMEIIGGNSLQPVKENYIDCRKSTRFVKLKNKIIYALCPLDCIFESCPRNYFFWVEYGDLK
jgi:hypothetical protein